MKKFGHRRLLVFAVVILAASSPVLMISLSSLSSQNHWSSDSIRSPPLARVYPSLSYDEQVGTTFTDNFSRIAFNVTAVAQSDPTTGIGPAYLLNGLTDADYWYQVGLSYNWPDSSGSALQGFRMSYEVFGPSFYYPYCNGSIFPATCGGGIDNLVVNPGDTVQLSLRFSGSYVEMRALDWNTGSTSTESFSSEGASQFVGLSSPANSDGFFTGLMTEQYFSTPYYGPGQPVTYRQTGLVVSSGTLWMDEFNSNTFQPVFSDHKPSPVDFSNTTLLQYFASHGTAEAASGKELITGLTPITLPSVNLLSRSTGEQGRQATIMLNIQDPSRLIILITSLNISIGSSDFAGASFAPSTTAGNSTITASITIPSSLPVGNYTLRVEVTFQFMLTQLPDWVSAQPISTNSTISVAKPSPPPVTTPPPTNPPITIPPLPGPMPASSPSTTLNLVDVAREAVLPALLVNILAALAVLVVVFRQRTHKTPRTPVSLSDGCSSCGGATTQIMMFCPSCGTLLIPRAFPTESGVQADP